MTTSALGKGHWVLGGLTLAALWFVLCRQLSGEWSVNEQYSYGWFVPFFAAFLFWLRWEDRPEPERPTAEARRPKGVAVAIAIVALLILFPVRLFEIANPDWRPLNWIHAGAVVAVTLIVLWFVGGMRWVRHFAFPVLFFFVAVPWISLIEEPIVQGLMRLIAAMATETITLFGVPAQLEGSLIRINTGLVGVNEACSGVRSLQTSLMIGLLFGELKRLSGARRCLLILGALVIALLANFGRALFLVWIAASRSVAAVSEWHDIAGYAIVAAVFLGSLLLAAVLARGGSKVESRKAKGESESPVATDLRPAASCPFLLSTSYFLISIAWLLAVEVGVELWYRSHEKHLASAGDWNIRPPEKAPGFREIAIDEQVRQTLRFDEGREVTWKNISSGTSTTNYVFYFRWNPGSSSVLRARAHRPDICLPNVGWTMIADLGTKSYSTGAGVPLAARHVTFRQGAGNAIAHTFFSLHEDRLRPNEARPDLELAVSVQPGWSFRERTRMVRSGIRNLGQRVLEAVVISSPPMDDAAAEAKFGEMVREIVVAGK